MSTGSKTTNFASLFLSLEGFTQFFFSACPMCFLLGQGDLELIVQELKGLQGGERWTSWTSAERRKRKEKFPNLLNIGEVYSNFKSVEVDVFFKLTILQFRSYTSSWSAPQNSVVLPPIQCSSAFGLSNPGRCSDVVFFRSPISEAKSNFQTAGLGEPRNSTMWEPLLCFRVFLRVFCVSDSSFWFLFVFSTFCFPRSLSFRSGRLSFARCSAARCGALVWKAAAGRKWSMSRGNSKKKEFAALPLCRFVICHQVEEADSGAGLRILLQQAFWTWLVGLMWSWFAFFSIFHQSVPHTSSRGVWLDWHLLRGEFIFFTLS